MSKYRLLNLMMVTFVAVSSLCAFTACNSETGTPDTGNYTVTFNANGGELSGETSTTVSAGNSISALPSVIREGYIFNGWYSSPTGGISVDPESYSVTVDVTFYAGWTAEKTQENPKPEPGEEKTVKRIKIGKSPKTQFFVGDTLKLEDGLLEVVYSDNTSSFVDISADGVQATVAGNPLDQVDTSKKGSKSVRISYEGKTCNVTLYINEFWMVTLDVNGVGENISYKAMKDSPLVRPETLTADGYTFYEWYKDKTCTVPYDFTRNLKGDITLYAKWKEDGIVYHEVIFDYGYYGCAVSSFKQIVKSGEKANLLSVTPEREEYEFIGWKVNGLAFDNNAAITSDTTVVADWKKTKTGSSTYTFEAEKTDLEGKVGAGLSGTATGTGMIVLDNTGLGASGGAYVSYLYTPNLTLDFYIASDVTVSNATLTVRIAAELNNINLNSDNYQIKVNGVSLTYSTVSLKVGGDFADELVFNNVTLNQGKNLIQLVTNNNVNPEGEGVGTYQATAPIVDCIKIATDAVLIWDENYGLPKD